MSRRDIIIIALLVNSSLLALLFMLAINIDDETVNASQNNVSGNLSIALQEIEIPSQEAASLAITEEQTHDEVDNFLKDLASEEPPKSIYLDEEGYAQFVPAAQPKTKSLPTPEPAKQADTAYVNVTVKKGDALEKIARNNGTTVDAIKKANHMTTTKLSIGQVLRIPVSQSSAEVQSQSTIAMKNKAPVPPVVKAPAVKPVPIQASQYYTIKSGDNPWKIAKQYNVPFEELLRLNNLDEERARNLKIGDKIRVK